MNNVDYIFNTAVKNGARFCEAREVSFLVKSGYSYENAVLQVTWYWLEEELGSIWVELKKYGYITVSQEFRMWLNDFLTEEGWIDFEKRAKSYGLSHTEYVKLFLAGTYIER